MPLTYREAKYVKARIEGKSEGEALRLVGFSTWIANSPNKLARIDEMRAEVERLQAELVQNTFEESLIDATEIHQYLSDALRANMRDIRNDDGSFKPISEWPEIWQRMVEGGDVDVEYASERSHDGETKDQDGGWDIKGKIEKVKYRFPKKTDLIKLAMQHKGVNALVQPAPPVVNVNNAIQIRWMDDRD